MKEFSDASQHEMIFSFLQRRLSKLLPVYLTPFDVRRLRRMRSNDPLVWVDCEVLALAKPRIFLVLTTAADDRPEPGERDNHVHLLLCH